MSRDPSFAGHLELARFVGRENRLKDNRTADAAFIEPTEDDRSNEHLSVNSLQIEGLKEIALYYQAALQRGSGDVAVSTTKVNDFADAGKKAGVEARVDPSTNVWKFRGRSGHPEDAFRYRPVPLRRDGLKSDSHCGVELVRVMKEHEKSKFARRLGGRKYHLVRLRNAT